MLTLTTLKLNSLNYTSKMPPKAKIEGKQNAEVAQSVKILKSNASQTYDKLNEIINTFEMRIENGKNDSYETKRDRFGNVYSSYEDTTDGKKVYKKFGAYGYVISEVVFNPKDLSIESVKLNSQNSNGEYDLITRKEADVFVYEKAKKDFASNSSQCAERFVFKDGKLTSYENNIKKFANGESQAQEAFQFDSNRTLLYKRYAQIYTNGFFAVG